MGGRLAPESVAGINRNGWPTSIGISGRNGAEYAGFSKEEIKRWSMHHLTSGCMVVSDGYSCFKAVVNAGCSHNPYTVGGGKQAVDHPAFKWVNTILGNVKNSLRGTYHSFSKKHIPRYLAEFQYRFDRRIDLASMVPRLAYVSVRTPPMPMRLLKLAEKGW